MSERRDALHNRPILASRFLIAASACYLALPYILFFLGWLKWYWAVFGVGLVLVPLLIILRKPHRSGEEQDPADDTRLGLHQLALVFVFSTVLLVISGIGGLGYQDPDWLKHNAILKDLIEQPWPVVYDYAGGNLPLVYYIAFYLPAACVGKLAGWAFANAALWIWSWIGLVLALLWFLVLVRRASAIALVVFVMFSGLDIIGEWLVTPLLVTLRPQYQLLVDWGHIERWAIGWEYSSNVTQIFWVPNQALAGWIATGVLLYAILSSREKSSVLFFYGLTALWSPLVMIGLAPYLVMDVLRASGTWLERLKRYWALPSVCGAGLLAFMGLYYVSRLYPTATSLKGQLVQGFSLLAVPDIPGQLIGLIVILIFCLLEFGLYAILISTSRRDWDSQTGALFVTVVLSLSLIPFYRFGLANDFAMRASIPSLFVLAILVSRALQSQSLPRLTRIALVALLLVGAVTPAIEFQRHLSYVVQAGTLLPAYRVFSMKDYWKTITINKDTIILQYVGSYQSPFFQYLAIKP